MMMLNTPFPAPIPITYQPQYALPIPIRYPKSDPSRIHSLTDSKREKKRKRSDNTEDLSFIKLSRDELLKFSSKEYEDYIKNLTKEQPLSPAELKEVKRQRRLIKNREYAQTSRNKKKELVGQMETQLEQLTNDNNELQNRVAVLNERVKQLEDANSYLLQENLQLKQTLEGISPMMNNVISTPPETPSSDDSVVDQFLNPISDSEDTSSPSSPSSDSNILFPEFEEVELLQSSTFPNWTGPSMYTSVITMFTIFLCFGLYLPNFTNNVYPTFPTTYYDARYNNEPSTKNHYPIYKGPSEQNRKIIHLLSDEEEPLGSFEFNSSSLPHQTPLSMEDVFYDEISSIKSPNLQMCVETVSNGIYLENPLNNGNESTDVQFSDQQQKQSILPTIRSIVVT